MKEIKFKSVTFSNKTKKITIDYTSGKTIVIDYESLQIDKNIHEIKIDKETGKKSLIIEYSDETLDFLPYDQPLHIAQDPEYMLQNQIEHITAQIKEALRERKMSKKTLAIKLQTSENQIQKLLNPCIINKNLTQLYKLARIVNLECEILLKAA